MSADSTLFCPAADSLVWRGHPANRGWNRSRIVDTLEAGFVLGPANVAIASWGDCDVVDGTALTDEEREELYVGALLARPKNEIKPIFPQATYLGTWIPALIIFDWDFRRRERVGVGEIYPCDVGYGEIVTINDYLSDGRSRD